MLSENYKNNYNKLKLKKNQIETISDYIEDKMLVGSRHCKESSGFVDLFNSFYWYIIGEADCKDIFSDEYIDGISVLSAKNIKIEQDRLKSIENFVDLIKSTLTDFQYEELKKSMNELYVYEKDYIDNEYYLEYEYTKGKFIAKYYFLKELMRK